MLIISSRFPADASMWGRSFDAHPFRCAKFGFGEDCLSKAIPVSTWAEVGKQWVGLLKKRA